MENDKAVFGDLVALSEKLITFAGRKSLSDWYRRELDDWLRDLIERRISPVDCQAADRLRLGYRQAIARSMDLTVDELDEWCEAKSAHIENEFAEPGRAEQGEDLDDDPWQEDLFGFEDVDPEPEAFETHSETDHPDGIDDEEDEGNVGQAVMDGRWAKALFRRAAQALHRDREPDPERRQVKQQQMRELLSARKHGDIMAMLTFYSDSVNGADIVFAEQEMTEICDAFEDQLEALKLEKLGYIPSHPVRHMVFELFYHNTKKGRMRRIQDWQQSLRHEMADLQYLVTYLRNLNCLKSVLEDRRAERSAMLTDVLFDDIRF